MLTATKCRALAKPGMHSDGRGLYFRIAPSGARGWILRATVRGRRREFGLGGFPAVSLAQARKEAEAMRTEIAEGKDPEIERRRGNVPTFKEAAEAVHAANLPRWRNGKHTDQWIQTLRIYAFPTLANMPVDQIERRDVLAILTPIWASKSETARRVRQRIRAVLKWAQAFGYVEMNAAGEAIDGALPVMPRGQSHFRALPHGEVAGALALIKASRASWAAKLCFRFLILTAARSGEARGAAWSEIDLEGKVWAIPAERMKAKAEHRIPLSAPALEVLMEAAALRDDSGLVFPSPHKAGAMLSDMTLTKLLRNAGLAERATVHGFRSSFRDWCADTGKPRELAEAALAHVVGGVEGAYFRSDILDRRRPVMGEWADYLSGPPASNVVRLRG